MKDRDWCKHIEAEVNSLKDRVKKLEGDSSSESPMPNIIELSIEWPEADVGGLQEDGNYYSSTPGGSCLGFRLSAGPAPKQAGKPA